MMTTEGVRLAKRRSCDCVAHGETVSNYAQDDSFGEAVGLILRSEY